MDDDLNPSTSMPGMFENEQPNTAQEEEITKQVAEIKKLMPNVEWMIGFIKEEREAISDFRAFYKELGSKPSANKIANEYRARELMHDFLNRMENALQNKVGNAQEVAKDV